MNAMKLIITLVSAVLFLTAVMILGACGADNPSANSILQGVKSADDAYALGKPVKLIYAIKNTGDKPVTYNFATSKQFDIWLKRGGSEVWRLSDGMMYAQAFTKLTIKPGETKTFEAQWNQKNKKGDSVGPGVYEMFAQLTPAENAPGETKGKVQIGSLRSATVTIKIEDAVKKYDDYKDKVVMIEAAFRGWSPANPNDPNVKDGPPVTRSDWAISDKTGDMYATGQSNLDPVQDIGTKVKVTGELSKAQNGQIYIVVSDVKQVK